MANSPGCMLKPSQQRPCASPYSPDVIGKPTAYRTLGYSHVRSKLGGAASILSRDTLDGVSDPRSQRVHIHYYYGIRPQKP